MSGKGSISRMSDDCLMTLEFGFPFCIVYQAVMRKFTLAGKIILSLKARHFACIASLTSLMMSEG